MAKIPTTPAEYLASLPVGRRAEIKALHDAVRKVSPRLKAFMGHNGTIIGYGPYHYKYTSGREGDGCVVGLSSRAHGISLYVMGHRDGKKITDSAKGKLGKVSVGSCCIRFKKLADLNLPAALALVREASTLLDNGRTDFSL